MNIQEEVTSVDEEGQQAALLELFRPYFDRLIEVLISKGQLPENENIFTSEDKEAFRCYRVDITDTMVSRILHMTREKHQSIHSFMLRCVCTMYFQRVLWKVCYIFRKTVEYTFDSMFLKRLTT
jgi:hypothetical protein